MNLLDIIGNDTKLKKTSGTRGGEYHGACPFCMDGDDRFWVHPHHGDTGVWKCRVCDKGGDAYRYVMEKRGLGFRAAKALVDGEPMATRKDSIQVDLDQAPDSSLLSPPADTPARERRPADGKDWQAVAAEFVAISFEKGWEGTEMQAQLAQRGITAEVAEAGRIGLSPKTGGIVIPCYGAGNVLRYVKVRTGTGQYYHVTGGDGSAIYGLPVLPVNPNTGVEWSGDDVILVETELDALMLRSVLAYAADLALGAREVGLRAITPLALGTAGGGHRHANTVLGNAHRVFVALDADEPGDKAATWWVERGAARLRPVGGKDPGDMWKAGGDDAVLSWFESAILG